MIEGYLRDPYQTYLVNPLAKKMANTTIASPNFITLLSLISGLFSLPLIAYGFQTSAILMILLSGYLDTLDGTLARVRNCSSPEGTVLDIVSDRIVELSIIFGLFFIDPDGRATTCMMMLGSVLICITSFLVVGIFSEKEGEKSFHYSPGMMERFEAFAFFISMIAVPSLFTHLGTLFALLVLTTAAVRVYQFVWKRPTA